MKTYDVLKVYRYTEEVRLEASSEASAVEQFPDDPDHTAQSWVLEKVLVREHKENSLMQDMYITVQEV